MSSQASSLSPSKKSLKYFSISLGVFNSTVFSTRRWSCFSRFSKLIANLQAVRASEIIWSANFPTHRSTEIRQSDKDLIIVNTKDNNFLLRERTIVAALIVSQYSLYIFVLRMMTRKEILLILFIAAVAPCKYLGGMGSNPVRARVFSGFSFVLFLLTNSPAG